MEKRTLTVLHLEDMALDAELLKLNLEEGFDLKLTWTKNKQEFIDALHQISNLDIIISDYRLPDFDAEEAFKVVQQLKPDVPFICVSGTIGEERAVELLKMGVVDYILKDRVKRLVPAVNRALKEAEEQRLLEKAEENLRVQNEELRIAKDRAEESDRLKTSFLNNISHEIRTPINGILGFIGLLVNEGDEEAREKLEKVIVDLSGQLIDMVDNVLKISMIESNQLFIDKKEVNIDDVVTEIYSKYRNKFEQKGISFNKIPTPTDLNARVVNTDKSKLSQILVNLCDNALKFTHRGEVSLGVELIPGYLQFFVKDSGVGVPQEKHHLVFERFRQVDEGLTRNYDGIGLGLPIAKAYVEALGGEIWFKTSERGTVFYFTIPDN